jgi:hypothetical protein
LDSASNTPAYRFIDSGHPQRLISHEDAVGCSNGLLCGLGMKPPTLAEPSFSMHAIRHPCDFDHSFNTLDGCYTLWIRLSMYGDSSHHRPLSYQAEFECNTILFWHCWDFPHVNRAYATLSGYCIPEAPSRVISGRIGPLCGMVSAGSVRHRKKNTSHWLQCK